jgi:hypothetical protein
MEHPATIFCGEAFVVGAGICGMHYLGMSALHFSEPVMWSIPGVLLSFLIAVMASFGAMLVLQRSGNEDFSIGRQVAASLVIGLAICGMHYTGMLAMMLPPGAVCLPRPGAFGGTTLARVGVGNTLVFMACLLIVFYRDEVRLLRTASDARVQAQAVPDLASPSVPRLCSGMGAPCGLQAAQSPAAAVPVSFSICRRRRPRLSSRSAAANALPA